MTIKQGLAILFTLTLFINGVDHAYGRTHENNLGFIHLRGELVNGTCVFTTQSPGMVIDLQQTKDYRSFFVSLVDCPPAIYNNLQVIFTSTAGGLKNNLLGTRTHHSFIESVAPGVALFDNQNRFMPLDGLPISLSALGLENEKIQMAASLLPEAHTRYGSGVSSSVTLRLMYP